MPRFLLGSVQNPPRTDSGSNRCLFPDLGFFKPPDFPFFQNPGCICSAPKTRSGTPERSGPNQTSGLWPLARIDQIIFRSPERRTITRTRTRTAITAELFRISWSLNLHRGDYRRLGGAGVGGGPKVSASDTILRNIPRKCRFLGSNCSQRPFFPRGSSLNPVCKWQPIDAVVELGWD